MFTRAESKLSFAAPIWPLVALAFLVIFMVAVPPWAGARRESLREQSETALDPARSALLELRHAFIGTVAETRGFLLTRDRLYLRRLRASLAAVEEATLELETASRRLGPDVTVPVQQLRTRTVIWLEPVASMVAGQSTPDELVANLEAGQRAMVDALNAVALVDRTLNDIEADIADQIGRVERLEDGLVAVLGLMAVLVGLIVAWLVLRLARASRRLGESEARFRQIAENVKEAIWIADPGYTTYYYLNPAYAAIWDRPIAEALEDPRSFLNAVHPEDRERVEAALERGYAAGDYDATYRIVRPAGDVRWIRARAYPVRDAEGRIFRVAGVAEDITEQRMLEDERERLLERERRAHEETQTALHLRDRVLRIVSHDLKNPLHTIGMAAELAGMPLPEEQREKQLDVIRRTVARANRMVLDLLDAAHRVGTSRRGRARAPRGGSAREGGGRSLPATGQ